MSLPDAPTPAPVEARLAGALDAASTAAVASLHATLEAAAGRPPTAVLRHEVVFAPRRATPSPAGAAARAAPPPPTGGELRLVRDLRAAQSADGVTAWELQSVGPPLRGRGAAAARAAARAVARTSLASVDAAGLLEAAGFGVTYERLFDGLQFVVARGSVRVFVRVGTLSRVPPGAGPPTSRAVNAAPGLLLVEASAAGGEAGGGEYGAASDALGGVADLVKPWVELSKE